MNCLIWCGPVSRSNLSRAVLPAESHVEVFNEGDDGIGSSAFARLGRQFGSLRRLLGSRGVNLDDCATVTLAGFSAAHGLIEVLLRDPESFERTDVLLAADAYYTGPSKTPKPGYRAYVDRAIAGQALCVLSTSSNAGPGYPSSDDAVRELVRDLGLSHRPPPGELGEELPVPADTVGAGGMLWLRFQDRLTHAEHATRLAPVLLSNLVTPYLERRAEPQSPSDALSGLGLLAGVAIGWELLK